jgi:putative ABC transport system substrate-binding protein
MTTYIGRRELIAVLGGAAAWPLAAHAQQGEHLRHLGMLMTQAEDDPNEQARSKRVPSSVGAIGDP